MAGERSRFAALGCVISEKVSDAAAHPYVQVGVLVVCAAWWGSGLSANVLTALLSVLAITLTQMVLNRQQEREAEAHRRDVAMHAKLDELVRASNRARDELAGIETLEEEEIERLAQPSNQTSASTAAGASPERAASDLPRGETAS
jgi:low affinity Fe/Cu permease